MRKKLAGAMALAGISPLFLITTTSAAEARPVIPKVTAAATGPRFDFDGDGRDEIVAWAWLDTSEAAPPGTPSDDALVVSYSSRSARQYLVPVPLPTFDDIGFGSSVAAGDFNGDGRLDLAAGAPYEDVPGTTRLRSGGGIWVFYGGTSGLDPTSPVHINQATAGVPGDMGELDMFGASLAAGDINRDGFAELVVGAPGDSVGATKAGTVTVLRGTAQGLSTTAAVMLSQDSPGVPETAEAGDAFGTAVAIGDVTGDGYADLAIGTPWEDILTPWSGDGIVTLIRGSASGLVSTGVTSIQGYRDVPAHGLGNALVIADVSGDGRGDVLVGTGADGGAMIYLPGTSAGLTAAGSRVINADTPGVPTDKKPNDAFGWAIATGDITGDGIADVLVSDMLKDVGSVVDAGAVFLLPGGPAGPTGAGAQMIIQKSNSPSRLVRPDDAHRAEPGDSFGYSVAILNLDGSGPLDMVAGAYSEFVPADTGNFPSGLLVTLRQAPVYPFGRPGAKVVLGPLTIGRSWSGADESTPYFRVFQLGQILLHS